MKQLMEGDETWQIGPSKEDFIGYFQARIARLKTKRIVYVSGQEMAAKQVIKVLENEIKILRKT